MNGTAHDSKVVTGTASALAAAIAAVLGTWSPAAMAVDPGIVTSCDDASTTPTFGTLRYAAANVPDGGTIDMSGLQCGKIFLNWANGSVIQLQQSTVTIRGPGKGALEIDGRWNQNCFSGGQPTYCPSIARVFEHTGTGKLTITDLTVSHGVSTAGKGGCIYSAGDLDMSHVDVRTCSATNAAGAKGGGVSVEGNLGMKYATISDATASASAGSAAGGGAYANYLVTADSTISGNTASGSLRGFGGGVASVTGAYFFRTTLSSNTVSGSAAVTSSYGGGAYANWLRVVNSSISGNHASGPTSLGGGLAGNTDVYLRNSTISDNTAYRGGAIYTSGASVSTTFGMVGSTISGNTAYRAAGVFTRAGGVSVDNSTIAFNRGEAEVSNYASGLTMDITSDGRSLALQSSIIAQNYAGSKEFDLNESHLFGLYPLTIAGSNNLLGVTKGNADPPNTSKLCPRLGPLRDNGGPTKTHALLSGSPAIDAGGNALALDEDQRGIVAAPPPWPYPRLDLVAGLADIGAFEVQQDDVVFDAAFEGCAELPLVPPG